MRNLHEVVLATKNKGKIREIKEVLKDLNLNILTLEQFSQIPEIWEDGKSFEENAVKKAKKVASYTNRVSLADDSGIEVDILSGSPGIYSSRFAGKPRSKLQRGKSVIDKENNEKLLNLLRGVPLNKRKARYRCVIAIASPEGNVITTDGTCRGLIAFKPKGRHGFGYDPIFYVPKYKSTMAELSHDLKNKISHRGKALRKVKRMLKEMLSLR